MKLANFHYIDSKGKESDRSVLVIQEPTNKLSGLDVSDMSDELLTQLAYEYEQAYLEFQMKIAVLKDKYDVKHNFRQFLEAGITDLEVEHM